MEIGIIKNISTSLDKFGRLIAKSLFMGGISQGKGDVRNLVEAGNFGIDSNPTADKRGLYTSTTTIGKYYVFGWLNTDRKAEVGETRMFSTNTDGEFKFNIWLKADGKALMGDSSNPADFNDPAVYFNELKTEFNKLKDDYNDHKEKWNYFVSNYVPGSPTVTGLPATLAGKSANTNTSNIDNAKNDKILYNK